MLKAVSILHITFFNTSQRGLRCAVMFHLNPVIITYFSFQGVEKADHARNSGVDKAAEAESSC